MNSRILASALAIALAGSALPVEAQHKRPRIAVGVPAAPLRLPITPSFGPPLIDTPLVTQRVATATRWQSPSEATREPALNERIIGASVGSLSGLFAGLVAGPDAAFIAAPLASVVGSALGSNFVAGGGRYWTGATLGAILGSLVAQSADGSASLLAYSAIHGVVTVLVGSR
jgi:hypothetical protein